MVGCFPVLGFSKRKFCPGQPVEMIKGDTTANHVGIYGIKGIATVSNKPGSKAYYPL